MRRLTLAVTLFGLLGAGASTCVVVEEEPPYEDGAVSNEEAMEEEQREAIERQIEE